MDLQKRIAHIKEVLPKFKAECPDEYNHIPRIADSLLMHLEKVLREKDAEIAQLEDKIKELETRLVIQRSRLNR